MTERKKWRIRNIMICISAGICLLLVGLMVQNQMPQLSADESGGKAVQNGPVHTGIIPGRLELIDPAVEAAIADGEVPGAVVLVSHRGKIEYFKAFGNRSLEPKKEPMTRDTIFDVSSLTKVMATTPSVMMMKFGSSFLMCRAMFRISSRRPSASVGVLCPWLLVKHGFGPTTPS